MVGYCFGPAVAAVLFELGGFPMAFLVFGILQLLGGLIIARVLPEDSEADSADLPTTLREAFLRYNKFLKFPFIYVFTFGTACAFLVNGFCDSTLEPGLERVSFGFNL